jgi:UPF0271 protein
VRRIDLNADVGELHNVAADAALFPFVTTAHVACGYHAGTPESMRATVAAAAAAGVVVGAHPSYPDRAGFGRREMDRPVGLVAADVREQLETLDGIARSLGASVRSVKPHGALYHRMASDEECARAMAGVVARHGDGLCLVVPAGSVARAVAEEAGVAVVAEAFCDRAYLPDGTPAARTAQGAVLTDPVEAARQAVSLAVEGTAMTVHGSTVALACQTLCVHGDTPGAPTIAQAVRRALEAAGVEVTPYANGPGPGGGRIPG